MVNGIIILDGPDCCGKTTLANKLIELNGHGKYIHVTYRFANKMPTYHGAILRKAIKSSKDDLIIIDRLHISEYIYAKVFRGGTKWPWQLDVFNQICKELNIPIVICIPDSIKRGIEWFEKTKQERQEMYEDMQDIIKEYIDYANNHDVIIYNRDLTSKYDFYYDFIFEKIKETLNGYKH